jgi:hypothetical protein
MFGIGFCANRNAGRSFSGYQAPISTNEMANYIYDFTLTGTNTLMVKYCKFLQQIHNSELF